MPAAAPDPLLVVRGGADSFGDDGVRATAEANFEMVGFWALSVFLASGNDRVRLAARAQWS